MDKLEAKALSELRSLLMERGRPSLMPTPPTGAEPAKPKVVVPSADQQAHVARVAPICELLYLMMSADGECGANEREMLRGAVRVLTAGSLRSAQIDAMLVDFEAQREAQGAEQRLHAVAAHLQVDRAEAEAAYSLAAAMALANHEVHAHESELLAELGDLIGISLKRRVELTQATTS